MGWGCGSFGSRSLPTHHHPSAGAVRAGQARTAKERSAEPRRAVRASDERDEPRPSWLHRRRRRRHGCDGRRLRARRIAKPLRRPCSAADTCARARGSRQARRPAPGSSGAEYGRSRAGYAVGADRTEGTRNAGVAARDYISGAPVASGGANRPPVARQAGKLPRRCAQHSGYHASSRSRG